MDLNFSSSSIRPEEKQDQSVDRQKRTKSAVGSIARDPGLRWRRKNVDNDVYSDKGSSTSLKFTPGGPRARREDQHSGKTKRESCVSDAQMMVGKTKRILEMKCWIRIGSLVEDCGE